VLQFPFSYQVFFDVGLNSNAFYAAADDYANGIATSNPALVNSALTWMDNHLRTGARSDWVSGPKGDLETLEGWRTVRHPRWETLANDLNADRPSGAGPVKIVNYEGGYGAQGPDAAACTHVGISTAYVAKCANLILAYKRSPLFYATSLLQLQECMAFSNYGAPSQFVVGTGPWSLRDGIDLYTPNVFGSWDATVYFNTH
jgi:hypothetical protein